MDDLTQLQRLLMAVNLELQTNNAPELLADFRMNYLHSRRTAHLRREKNRLEQLIELERATMHPNYSGELLEQTI
jgi:hypothetical protein